MTINYKIKKISIVVVLYKKLFSDSDSLKSLLLQKLPKVANVELMIWDNSPEPFLTNADIENLSRLYRVEYIHNSENLPLRHVYNHFLTTKVEYDDSKILFFLDDDTSLPEGYLQNLVNAADTHAEIDIFVPLVYVDGAIYSPHNYRLFHGELWKEKRTGVVSTLNVGCINSCMAIRARFFIETNYRYPSFCKSYGTDKHFFDYYSSKRDSFYVMDIAVNHDISFMPNNPNSDSYLRAFKEYVGFWMAYLQKKPLIKFIFVVYAILFSLRETLKRRDLRFVKIFSNSRVKATSSQSR